MKNAGRAFLTAFVLIVVVALSACERKVEPIPEPESPVSWTWVSGGDKIDASGVYGTIGTPSASNVPGAREDLVTWVDAGDRLWLFGGYGHDSTGFPGRLNDLWRYDPTAGTWTWVSGSSVRDQAGVYGTLGVPGPANVPGARNGAVSWSDAEGRFWLFGGLGFDSAGSVGQLNDLWRFDPAAGQWTWIGGGDVRHQAGVYGTPGVPDPANVPGARTGAAGAVDADGGVWIFGGYGYDAAGDKDRLNDLWRYDPATALWTWISGSDAVNEKGVYGTITEPDPENVPGARNEALAWIDLDGNIWVLGGYGLDYVGTRNKLNDLWMFDPSTSEWTFMDGNSTVNAPGAYGDLNATSTENMPGSRYGAVGWFDSTGAVYVFGGYGLDASGGQGWLNDLWRYDSPIESWAWKSGSSARGVRGYYGTKGTASKQNIPGARYLAAGWVDSRNVRWIFGGYGLDTETNGGRLNDLWRQTD